MKQFHIFSDDHITLVSSIQNIFLKLNIIIQDPYFSKIPVSFGSSPECLVIYLSNTLLIIFNIILGCQMTSYVLYNLCL